MGVRTVGSPMFPDVPGGAFDQFVGDAEQVSQDQRVWTPNDGPMPALYLSHGAPPLFDDAPWIGELVRWAQALPKPRAILIVSAHGESAPMMLSASGAGTPLVYDFGGFHPRYYQMTYRTPDAGDLARRGTTLLPDREPVHEHPSRGLDHGAWGPLKVMYPLADVPVLQLSIPTSDPGRLLALGARLRPLRESGVLVIGSGFLTHGLPFLTPDTISGAVVPGWSAEFDHWAGEALARGDVEALADYRRAPGMPYAHPTADHFLPLFVTLGSADDPAAAPVTVIDGYWMGLAKRSFQVA